jgi:alpha-tubulin suppressor-like RCC1 family protein
VDIAAGGPFSVILTKEGRVFTCGYGGGFETLEPKPINNLDNVIKIYAATDYAAAITGKSFCPLTTCIFMCLS